MRRIAFPSLRRLSSLGLICALTLSACQAVRVASARPEMQLPVRFLITFDDGPSGALENNSSALILDTLAHNRWQNGIKAIFFVQTRHRNGGGTAYGREIMQRMLHDGHLLGLHTASERGHINHTQMPLSELEDNLKTGIEDIKALSGEVPRFIRPPFWSFNAATLSLYEAQGLSMLLDDISIRDGKIHGVTSNPNVRARIHSDLHKAAQRIRAGEVPAVAGYIPLVMTMHDTNPTTARDLETYLGMLIDEAQQAGLVVHAQPFISPGEELAQVANLRAHRSQLALADELIKSP